MDYLDSSAGGWEEMFPTDSPWGGHPFHGVLWSAPFAVRQASEIAATLAYDVTRPPVSVEYEIGLLGAPRCGARLTVTCAARGDTGPFLWASHPMLAVAPGWRIATDGTDLIADEQWPGRFVAGRLAAGQHARALTVAGRAQKLNEVLYAEAATWAEVRSPRGDRGTRVRWDAAWLRHLWIVTVAADSGIDLALLLEPCTSRPFELGAALERGTARHLRAGARRGWWVEVESLDETPLRPACDAARAAAPARASRPTSG